MKQGRRVVQGVFLLLFLFLFIQTEAKGLDDLGYPVKIFLDFDPLILAATLLSAHAVEKAFLFSVGLIVATMLLGRVFCGWICPLGTLNNIIGSMRRPAKPHNSDGISEGLYRVKYLLLIFILVSSVFSLQLVGVFDPLSLLIRSLSVSIYPAFNSVLRDFFDSVYDLRIKGLSAITEPVYTVLKKTVLSFQQPHFRQSFFVGSIFLFILGLNLYERRFWCKYLCPLGALLGLLSRYSLLKRSVSEGCTECGACAGVCQGNARPDGKEAWQGSECLYCRNCDDVCPQNAVSFGFTKRPASGGIDLGRRRVITSAVAGMAAVPLIKSGPFSKKGFSDPGLIRPPGSLAEEAFLSKCVKCGECMKVCITNGLQPALLEAGIEGIWSPTLVPRLGYCEFRCTLCGQVCPTGAIKRLAPAEKAKVKIGLAMVDKGRCLPYAHATPCIVCEEVCPTPKKAIWLEEVVVKDRLGNNVAVQQPRVDVSLCIGCGICETKCPVGNRAAIYVTNIGETRSEDNRLLI